MLNFKKNYGQFTYIHGDFSPDNLFMDDDFNITIIDPSQLMKSTKNSIPMGFPACDYHQFIFSVRLLAKKENINFIEYMIEAFKTSYHNNTMMFTSKADLMVSTH